MRRQGKVLKTSWHALRVVAQAFSSRVPLFCVLALFTFVIQPGSAAIAFVQGNSLPSTPSASSVTVTYTSAQSAGDLNVVIVGWMSASPHVSSVTDSRGNTYALAFGPTTRAGFASQSVYYAKN